MKAVPPRSRRKLLHRFYGSGAGPDLTKHGTCSITISTYHLWETQSSTLGLRYFCFNWNLANMSLNHDSLLTMCFWTMMALEHAGTECATSPKYQLACFDCQNWWLIIVFRFTIVCTQNASMVDPTDFHT